MSEPDYRAMWEELRGRLSAARGECGPPTYECDTWDDGCRNTLDATSDHMDEIEADYTSAAEHVAWVRTPDPDHTPAVRRVVAWEVDDREGELVHDPVTAYQNAADSRLENSASTPRFWRRLEARSGADRLGYWRAVRNRLASLLRHRDEKAGHR